MCDILVSDMLNMIYDINILSILNVYLILMYLILYYKELYYIIKYIRKMTFYSIIIYIKYMQKMIIINIIFGPSAKVYACLELYKNTKLPVKRYNIIYREYTIECIS